MEIFRLFGSIFIDNEAANRKIDETDSKGRGFAGTLASSLGKAVTWGAGVAAAATAAVGGMVAIANKTAAAADEIDKMSERTGIGRERLQELKYAAGQSGVEFDTLEQAVKKMSVSAAAAADGNKTATAAFRELGISVRDSNGNLKSTNDLFNEAVSALADMDQGVQRNALGNQIFGRSYTEMLPLLNAGSDGIKDLTDRSRELGLVMSEDAVRAGVKFGDTMDDIKQVGGAIVNQLGSMLMPVLQRMLDWILQHMPQIQAVVSAVFRVIGQVIGGAVKVIGTVIDAIEAVINAARTAWDWLSKVFGGGTSIGAPSESVAQPRISVPAMAAGGTVRVPGYALVGERGPELLSLPRGAQVTPLPAQVGSAAVFERGAFEGAVVLDDYGVDRLMDRVVERLAQKGVRTA